MPCLPYRFALPALAVLCAGIQAQDGLPISQNPKLPGFRMTVPETVPIPVEKDDVVPTEPPVLKKKDFFGVGSETKVLTLNDAIQMALKNNLDAKVEEVGVLVEEARVRGAQGAYDPVLSFSATRSWSQTPDARNNITSADAVAQLGQIQAQIDAINQNTLANQEFTNAILQATGRPPRTFNTTPQSTDLSTNQVIVFDQDLDRSELALQARSPLGTVVQVSARASRIRSTFEGDTRVITPTYSGSTTIEAKQPLLKDAGLDANLAEIRISKKNKQAQELTWRFKIEATMQQVVSTYYEMILGMADLENKGDAITAGLRLVAQSQRRNELGFFSPYEVQQAQVQLSFDRENLLVSKNYFLGRQYEMQRLVLPEYQEGKLRIILPAQMPSLKVPKLDREALVALAFEKRLDYKAAIALAESEDLRVKYAKNQQKPQLDIVGSYGWSGLDDSYKNAFNQMTNSQGPSWSLGVQAAIPLGGVTGKAQVSLAQGRKQQAQIRVQKTELEIGTGVEQAIELIRTNQERLKTADLTVKSAEDAVKVGYRRLEEGLISNFDLIEQQRRLFDARTRELNAKAELNKAVTQLWLATGTVMENLGINYTEESKAGKGSAKKAPTPAPAPPVPPAEAKPRKRK